VGILVFRYPNGIADLWMAYLATNWGTGPRPSKTGRDPVQLPVQVSRLRFRSLPTRRVDDGTI
jgi:hypothetical protein